MVMFVDRAYIYDSRSLEIHGRTQPSVELFDDIYIYNIFQGIDVYIYVITNTCFIEEITHFGFDCSRVYYSVSVRLVGLSTKNQLALVEAPTRRLDLSDTFNTRAKKQRYIVYII